MIIRSCCAVAALLFLVVSADPITFEKSNEYWMEADRITNLPDVEIMPDFPMYSGYLDVNQTDHLFYWLVHSTNSSSNNLIIWFNGGPGCSSLDGFFYENGPFLFTKHSDKLQPNPHSWNKLGHVLYIESPVETGFSYTEDDDPNRSMDDDQAAVMNLKALKNFYARFPQFADMDLYITGESYAGVYIPTLATEIVKDGGNIKQHLKGLYIGNGLLNSKMNLESAMEYVYYHGFIGPTLWNEMKRLCCRDGSCTYDNFVNDACMEKVAEFRHSIYSDGLNIYNFADDCAVPNENLYENGRFYGWHTKDKGEHRLYLQPVCADAEALTTYLNRRDVRMAIHARQVDENDAGKWELCSTNLFFSYNKIYDDLARVMRNLLREMDQMKILLYFGDFDLACNFLGGERFVDQLGLEMTISRRSWMINRNGHDQIAGFYKEYGNLIYATIKAAGHMVPTDKPTEIFALLQRIMSDHPI